MRTFFLGWISVVCAAAVMGWFVLSGLPDGRLHLYALDVGQGDGMLMRLPHGGTVLIDAGPGSNIVEPLRHAMGWLDNSIDLVVVTHFDRDHCEGLLKVFENYHVGHVLITGVEQRTELQQQLFSMIAMKKIPVWIAASGRDLVLDWSVDGVARSVILDTLAPFDSLAGRYLKDANESSIISRILVERRLGSGVDSDGESNSVSSTELPVRSLMLTTGDSGFPTEERLVDRYGSLLHADILKVGHHGSRYSSGDRFLATVGAMWAIISVSAKNTYNHPHPDAVARLQRMTDLSHILRTDQRGTIEMVYDFEREELSLASGGWSKVVAQ